MLDRNTIKDTHSHTQNLVDLLPKYKKARKDTMIVLIANADRLNKPSFPYEWIQGHITNATLMKLPHDSFLSIATLAGKHLTQKQARPIIRFAKLYLDRLAMRETILNQIGVVEWEHEYFIGKRSLSYMDTGTLLSRLSNNGVTGLERVGDRKILLKIIDEVCPFKVDNFEGKKKLIRKKYCKLNDLDLVKATTDIMKNDEESIFTSDGEDLKHYKRQVIFHRGNVAEYLKNNWKDIPPNLVKKLNPSLKGVSDKRLQNIVECFQNFKNLHPNGIDSQSPHVAATIHVGKGKSKLKRNITQNPCSAGIPDLQPEASE